MPSEPSGLPSALRDLAVVAGVVALGGLVWFGWGMFTDSGRHASRTETPREARFRTQVYEKLVGDRACEECHSGEVVQHGKSGHSKTLRRIEDVAVAKALDGRTVADPERAGESWHYAVRPGRGVEVSHVKGEPSVEQSLLEYAFGSGKHALTFVAVADKTPRKTSGLEHRLTHFHAQNRLGVTPGQVPGSDVPASSIVATGRTLDDEHMRKCFSCHSTVMSDRGDDCLDPATLKMAIGCERCHGPGKDHIESARSDAMSLAMRFGPGRATAVEEIRLCGECHRLPEMAPPGSLRPDNPELARFQPVGLLMSRCFQGSRNSLRCTTCHNPHGPPSTDTVRYEATCLSCHSGKDSKSCSVNPKDGCISCHMPRVDAGQGVMFTDHWIRPRREAGRPLIGWACRGSLDGGPGRVYSSRGALGGCLPSSRHGPRPL